uniref:Major capsid protein VP1 n=1 Tax=WU polyomavirus TaxID=440266 RepID=D3XCE8_POVWU|nr:VP1 [WU Polyomavirus]ADD50926.1 VP1 [WU Polyomavirus]ADD50931.1 VP1 [WU Polyomavirus]UJY54021.1 major capsid protein VP1 [WU Polyomavirus]
MACTAKAACTAKPGRSPRSQPTRLQSLPKQVRKGGVDVLSAVPLSEETEFKVELFVKPVIGNAEGTTPHYWSISSPLKAAEAANVTPDADTTVCYSLSQVAPPDIPNQVSECDMLIWELYRMETEVLVLPFLNAGVLNTGGVGGIAGPQLYFWAVGGQPLDVLGIAPTEKYKGPAQYTVNPKTNGTVPHVYSSSDTPRARVTNEKYSIESWVADPSRNDNCRYFGRMVGGAATPPVVSFSNNSTIPLLDENGIGILCLQGRLYITCADLLGVNKNRVHTGLSRFFRLHFRQRRVRNPYTINLLYKQVFNKPADDISGQLQVTEVTMTEETGPLPPTVEGNIGVPTTTNLSHLPATVTLQATGPILNTQG